MRIEHVAIWVRDIERPRQFFEKYFGAIASPRYDNTKGFSSCHSYSEIVHKLRKRLRDQCKNTDKKEF